MTVFETRVGTSVANGEGREAINGAGDEAAVSHAFLDRTHDEQNRILAVSSHRSALMMMCLDLHQRAESGPVTACFRIALLQKELQLKNFDSAFCFLSRVLARFHLRVALAQWSFCNSN